MIHKSDVFMPVMKQLFQQA